MKPVEGYNESQAFTGESMQLPAGLYVCQIKMAIEEERKGKRLIAIAYEIAEGEYKGFFQKKYDADKNQNKKWPGIHRQLMEGESLPFFKGLMTSIEESNPGYTWNWDENSLKGKKFGAVMGREEFMTQDGQKKMATKIRGIRSVEGLKNATVPEDKLLPDNQTGYQDMPPTGGFPTDADAPMNW